MQHNNNNKKKQKEKKKRAKQNAKRFPWIWVNAMVMTIVPSILYY